MRAHLQHLQASDALGLARLSISATLGVTDLVEQLHHTILQAPLSLGQGPLAPRTTSRTSGITGLVYRSIRGVTKLVGGSLDATLGPISALLPEGRSSPQREGILAALNGVLGDHLAATNNPLAITMGIRREGRPLRLESDALAAVIPAPSPRLLLMIHGLCLSDLQWERGRAATEGEAERSDGGLAALLARELGLTPVFLHYDSGRHISTNGRELASLLETLVSAWPVPVEELTIVAHSMGGLVARSACHQATLDGRKWVKRLRHMVFLGTPHHGAPLERGGNQIDLLLDRSPYTAPFARLGKIRSAGITDLRHGNLLDHHWRGHDRFAHTPTRPDPVALPEDTHLYAIAATLREPTSSPTRLLGDGLVPLASALGHHDDPAHTLPIAPSRRWIAEGISHLDLLDHPAVHAQVCRWLVTALRGRFARR